MELQTQKLHKNPKLLYPSQTLIESLKNLDVKFLTLAQIFPNLKFQNIPNSKFFQNTYVFRDPKHQQIKYNTQYTQFDRILDQNIQYLLISNKLNYIQVSGHQLKQHCISFKNLNLTRSLIINTPLGRLGEILHKEALVDLIFNYTVLVQYKNQYIQVLGLPIHQNFGFKVIGEKKRKTERQWLDYSIDTIHRVQIFYCTHTGRNAGTFRKNIFFQNGMKSSRNQTLQIERLVQTQLNLIFSPLKNKNCLRVSQIAGLKPIMIIIFQNFRNLLQYRTVKKGNYFSKFNSIIANHCRLPTDYKIFRQKIGNLPKLNSNQVAQLFNKMYDYATSYENMFCFLKSLIQHNIPDELLGSKNKHIFIRFLKDFVEMKRFENLKVQDLLVKMDVFQIQWMKQQFKRNFKTMIITRKRKILAGIICFIYNKILIPILKYNFYVTQQHKEANKIFYYRKPLWILISKLAVAKFSQQNIEPLQLKGLELANFANNYPQGKLRILPKKDCFRPIITFNRKKKSSSKFNQNLNQLLADTQLVLRNLKNLLGNNFGFSVFDNNQIFTKYDQFLKKWREKGQKQLFYFTLDIKKCYDSISSYKLNQIIQNTPLIQHSYIIIKYFKIYRNKKALTTKKSMPYYFNVRQRAYAIPMKQDPLFLNQSSYPPSILVLSPRTKIIKRQTILGHLKHVCQKSVIKYLNRNWTLRFGIPQGLNVSGVLCSLYFAQLESRYVKIKDGLLMRLTDDYVYIGTQQQGIKVFDDLMRCAKDNGFIFNQQKIKSNVNHPTFKIISNERNFIWIGKQINITTLEVIPAVEIDAKKLSYSMNVNIPKKNYKNFLKNKLKSLLTNHFSSYFKPNLYQQKSIQKNLRLFCKISLHKFFPFLEAFLKYKITDSQIIFGKIIQVTVHQFVVYCCFLYQQTKNINIQRYYQIMLVVLQEFYLFFKLKRSLGISFYFKMESLFFKRMQKIKKDFMTSRIKNKRNFDY